jgi:oligoribonuclease NrnB/cAMP/cGMP phosphodiesterase (DHH superfamily)
MVETAHIIVHSPCSDGFGAAYAAWHYNQHNRTIDQKYYGYTHGQPWPELVLEGKDEIIFADVCPPIDVVRKYTSLGCTVTVLDHHKSAVEQHRADYEALQAETNLLFYFVFDMDRSGAQLMWDHCSSTPHQRPVLLDYIADRDLWQWKLDKSKEISAFLNSLSMTLDEAGFQEFDLACEFVECEGLGAFQQMGLTVLLVEDKHISMLLERTATGYVTMVNDDGQLEEYEFPAANCPVFFASEVGHRLLEKYPDAPFAASFRVVEGNVREWSLRSTDDRADVSRIAKVFGGGGHRNAAGFQEKVWEETMKVVLS